MTQSISSRDFNQDVGRAKRTALEEPVLITDRGRPSHVLISYAEYSRLTGGRRSLADVLAMEGPAPDLDITRAPDHPREVDFG